MLKANLKSVTGYAGADLDKLNRALLIIESLINGDTFKKAVLNFATFQFTTYKCLGPIKMRTVQLQEFTNQQIVDILMKGHRQQGADTYMDLQLLLSTDSAGSAVGQTDDNGVTTTYKSALDNMIDGELAAHLTHEWTHTLGFTHSYSDTCDSTRNCLSVPYAIGNIIELISTGECWYGCSYPSLNNHP